VTVFLMPRRPSVITSAIGRAIASLIASVSVLALLVSVAACHRTPPPARGDRPDFGGDFALTNQHGQPFQLTQLRGKVVLLFFGYTFCPDMCPMTMAHITDVMTRLGDARAEVAPVFVSLDPQRDTPATIEAYVTHFSPQLTGLTGTPADIARVAAQYHVSYNTVASDSPDHAKDYLINHTTAIFLIDRQGALRDYVAYNEPTERLVAAVRALLQER
jgi:cytochrome oxidase Cu insertion factor (SCO1/SenC/PrrC family)